MHKNENDAVENYCIYEITVNRVVYKIGKADLDRITLCSGDPTRIHQQLLKLRKKYGVDSVAYEIVERLFNVKTKKAKAFEKAILQLYYEFNGVIPPGNTKSFKPEVKSE